MRVQVMLEYYGRREIPGGNGNRRPGAGPRRRRGEYPSHTPQEQAALWAQHKDDFLALVAQRLDPNRHCPEFAKRLGVTREESHMLCTAYIASQSLQEEPLDLSLLDEDA